MSKLEANRLTLVYGESGVGKTSLLHAGVLPALDQRAIRDPFQFTVAYCDSWTGDVTGTVANAFLGTATTLYATERRDLHEVARKIGKQGQSVLAIFDQFEDYFLYHPNDNRESAFEAQFASVIND